MAEAGNHSKLRLEWLDALKGVAILSVVLGHILLGYTGNNMFPEVNATMLELMKWIYIWHMPLFMAISGFSFSVAYINEQKINKRKIVRGGGKSISFILDFLHSAGRVENMVCYSGGSSYGRQRIVHIACSPQQFDMVSVGIACLLFRFWCGDEQECFAGISRCYPRYTCLCGANLGGATCTAAVC